MKADKKDKKYSTNRIILPILFVVCAIILEISNFLYFGFKNLNGSRMAIPTYFLFDIAVILMIGAFIFVLQKKYLVFAGFCLFLLAQVVINIINVTLFSLFGEILNANTVKLGGEARTAFTFDMIDWGGTMLNVCLGVAGIVGAILLLVFNHKTYSVKHFSMPIIAFAIFLLVEAFGAGFYSIQVSLLKDSQPQESEVEFRDKYLWDNFHFKLDAYKKFGYYGFYTKEIYGAMFHKKIKENEETKYINFIDQGYTKGNPDAPLYNDNLIVILLESVDEFGIDPIYTPTLWELWQGQDTIAFTNFYARNRTNNSEGITLLGSMPINSSLKDAYKAGYNFAYSLPNLFERGGSEDVTTAYVHTNVASFYNRDITHKNDGIGFDKIIDYSSYKGDMVNEKWGDWILDEEFVKSNIDEFLPTNGRFLTYFTTLSTHGPFTFEKQYFTEYYDYYDQYLDDYKIWLEANNFNYPTDKDVENQLRNFKVGTIDLDHTIKYILQEISNRGLTNNTSILMFADHNVYYHDLVYNIKGINKADITNTKVNRIPAMLYSPALTKESGGKRIDTFCNTYDLLPTICDLYGLESNTNIFQGYSIFSDKIINSFFASHLGGMFTDKIYSQNIQEIYIRDEVGVVTEEEINRFRDSAIKFYENQEKLEKIYRNGINGKIINI